MMPGPAMSPNTNDKCDQCHSNYSFMKKKKTCNICQQFFCGTCAPRIRTADQSYRCCLICQLISNPETSNEQLISIKVKHLRCFLRAKDINHDRCTEKSDLVDLIRRSQNVPFVRQPNQQGSLSSSNSEEPFAMFSGPFSNLATNVQALFSNASDALNSLVNEPSPPTRRNMPNEPRTSATSTRTMSQPPPPRPPPSTSQPRPAPPPPPSSTETRSQATNSNVPSSQPTRASRKSLSEITSEEHIESLNNRELKEILAGNFVNYKGCVEKSELVDKVRRLYRDREDEKNRISASNNEQPMNTDSDLCKICLDAIADCVFLDCGHMVTCVHCGKLMAECPICRAHIVRVVRVFKS